MTHKKLRSNVELNTRNWKHRSVKETKITDFFSSVTQVDAIQGAYSFTSNSTHHQAVDEDLTAKVSTSVITHHPHTMPMAEENTRKSTVYFTTGISYVGL